METRYDAYYERDIPYKMTLDELKERSKDNYKGQMREEDILAYIRYRGDKFRCMAKSAVRGIMSPLGLMASTDDEEMVLCRLVTGKDDERFNDSAYNPLVDNTFHENSWYSAYKLALTPALFNGCIDKYYVSDFCSILNDGYITIVEPENVPKPKIDWHEKAAIILYYLGFKHGATHNICEELSLGFGELDDNGFWEYPIPNKLLPHIVIDFFWQYESIYRSFFTIIKEYRSPYKKIKSNDKWIEEVQYAKMLFEFPKIRRGK